MQSILDSFFEDLDDISNTFLVLKSMEKLRETSLPEIENKDNDFEKKTIRLYSLIDGGRKGIVKIPGVFVLYIGGRFEDYVKTIFEEFAINFANGHSKFNSLPTKFQNSIIADTSKIISSPKKYGYRDGMVNTFIDNLSKNVNQDDFSNINHQCLSKTEGNMRSDILSDLFLKISIKDIWKDVGTQLSVRTHFLTQDPSTAQNEAKKYLDNFMITRNQIAHPNGSSGGNWPSHENVLNDIKYFKMLSKVLLQIGQMKIASLNIQN